jgi:hypothetical protein
MECLASARVICLAAASLTVTGRPAAAQMCAGRAPFDLASPQFGLDAGLNRSGQGAGVDVGHGTDNLFGIGTLLRHADDEGATSYMLSATIGTDQPLTPDNVFRVCPMITVGYISGSGVTSDDGGRFGLSIAGDASMMVMNTPRMRVALTIGLDVRKHVGRAASLNAQDARRTYHTFSGGIGFLISNRLSLVPKVVVPFGPIDQTGVYVAVVYNVLRR